MKKLTLVLALFGILLIGFGTAANAGFSVDFGFGIGPAAPPPVVVAPPPVVVPPPVYYPYSYPVPAPYYYPAPGYYAPRYYVPPPVSFGFRFGDRGWNGRHVGHHWR